MVSRPPNARHPTSLNPATEAPVYAAITVLKFPCARADTDPLTDGVNAYQTLPVTDAHEGPGSPGWTSAPCVSVVLEYGSDGTTAASSKSSFAGAGISARWNCRFPPLLNGNAAAWKRYVVPAVAEKITGLPKNWH